MIPHFEMNIEVSGLHPGRTLVQDLPDLSSPVVQADFRDFVSQLKQPLFSNSEYVGAFLLDRLGARRVTANKEEIRVEFSDGRNAQILTCPDWMKKLL